MSGSVLQLPDRVWRQIWTHLLPGTCLTEEAGFLLVSHSQLDNQRVFEYEQWIPLRGTDFTRQYGDYLELADSTKSRLIKSAHDKDACLVEFHSHPGPYPAMFSAADRLGFEDFVPHVLWRLKRRPYMAIVVASSGFDALVWTTDVGNPSQLTRVQTEAGEFSPTNLTLKNW
ncbi:MAG TPA: hypothetical protein ENJ84_01565 [Gammaproteobacteria bacterium]|nr:hypothetical protein [Gammaproteobacteria bacterium]